MLLPQLLSLSWQGLAVRPPSRTALRMAATSREDAESNARLLKALMEDGEDGSLVDKVWSSINEEENSMVKDPTVASHLQLDLDDDGKPLQLRFLYVDELDCIGCTYCASIARNSFVMEPDAGRARAFAQGADDPEIVLEAIDSCPVNCISFVDHADLVILENERDGVTIDQRSSGYRHGDQSRNNLMHETKAKLGTGMMCCNNCPSRGCKACPTYLNPSPNPNPSPDPNPISNPNQECPMYGVGLNPVYIARQEELQAKREARHHRPFAAAPKPPPLSRRPSAAAPCTLASLSLPLSLPLPTPSASRSPQPSPGERRRPAGARVGRARGPGGRHLRRRRLGRGGPRRFRPARGVRDRGGERGGARRVRGGSRGRRDGGGGGGGGGGRGGGRRLHSRVGDGGGASRLRGRRGATGRDGGGAQGEEDIQGAEVALRGARRAGGRVALTVKRQPSSTELTRV